jgi:hypothetical protein
MAEVKDPMIEEADPSSRAIRDSIRRTRAQMDATVEAIEEKLSPGELAHEAWSLLRGGSGSSVNRIWRIARQHPMPAAIISVGLGWMVYESARADDGEASARYARRPPGGEPEARTADEPGVGQSAAGSALHRTGELAGQARDVASGVAGSVREQASELGHQASELGSETRRSMQRARAGFRDTLQDQPLVVGAAVLAAGVLAGLLLPSTPIEDEVMGTTRDSLIDEVRGLGQDVLEKGKQVATAAADSARQGEGQGPSGEAIADKARSVGRDAVEAVPSETQQPGGAPEAPKPQPGQAQPMPQPPRHRAA